MSNIGLAFELSKNESPTRTSNPINRTSIRKDIWIVIECKSYMDLESYQ